MQGRVDGGEGAAHAVSEQGYLRRSGEGYHLLDHPVQVALDIVVESNAPVLVTGRSPVHGVYVETLSQQVPDEAAARNQVQDVQAIDESIDDKHRYRLGIS